MIEFFSTIQGVTETYPILPAKKVIPSWVKCARDEAVKNQASVAKCPGIIDIMTTGFIVVSPYDMEVQSSDDSIITYANPEIEDLLGKPPAQTQAGDSIAKHIPKRPWSNKSILKINTPWHIKSEYKFMMIPIPYAESFGFESCSGILDPSISSEINIQGYVNGYGSLEIKAGDPLCQLIPITQDTYEFEVRDMNDADREWIQKRKFINNSTFRLNKNLIKKAYRRFIGK